MTQSKFRFLQFPKRRCRGKDADRKEQDKQAIADSDQSGVDIDDHAPYLPALKRLRRLGNELPQLGQLLVPGGNGVFEVSYDPVITYGLHLSFTKSFQRKSYDPIAKIVRLAYNTDEPDLDEKEESTMSITATELKQNLSKYLLMAEREDVFITRNGKVVAKLSNPYQDRVDTAKSLFGILPGNMTIEQAHSERLDRV